MDTASLEKLAFRAKVARWSLIVFFIAFVAQYGLTFGLILNGPPAPVATIAIGVIGLGSYIALLVFVIAYFLWLHRASRNLHDSVAGMRFSSAWHVASYFVPLVNWVVPFLAMRELWNRSHGEPPELAGASVGAVVSWWACWVGLTLVISALVLRILASLYTNIVVMAPPLLDIVGMVFAVVLMLGASGFLLQIIGSVTRAQTGFVNVAATFA